MRGAVEVALTLIAQQLKDDELKELRDTFIKLDKDRDGTLSTSAGLIDHVTCSIEVPRPGG